MEGLRGLLLSLTDFRKPVPRRLMILVLMGILLYQGVGIFYKGMAVWMNRMRPATTLEAQRQPVALVQEPISVYGVIAERNLFGTVSDAVGRTPTAQRQDAELPFDVKGTVAGTGRYGFAIIEEKETRKQRLVKVGNTVFDAKVIRIKRNAVDVLVAGRERTLKIVETREAPILPPQGKPAAVTASAAPGSIVIPRSEVDAALQDMGKMLSQAQVRPYFNAGVPDGFIIGSIRPGSLYQRMGIANGDIIQEVNNQRIQTADDVMGLMDTIKSGSSLSLGIKRQGKSETLNYQFQ